MVDEDGVEEEGDLERRKLEKYRLDVLLELEERKASLARVIEKINQLDRRMAENAPWRFFLSGDVRQMQLAQAKGRDLLKQKEDLELELKEREQDLEKAKQILLEVEDDLKKIDRC